MLEVKTTRKPDEKLDFPRGHLETMHLSGLDFSVATFEPGWRWSESVGPIVGTKTCQASHHIFMVQGRMRVRMDDGSESEVSAGDVCVISPGHDAWVIGDQTCVAYDMASGLAAEIAKAEGAK